MTKKRFGIIGGMGTNAGIAFLNRLVKKSSASKDQEFPDFIYHNNSTVPDRTRHILWNEPSPVSKMLESVKLFEDHGVDYMTSVCITSFYFEPTLKFHTDIPIINPIRLLAKKLERMPQQIMKVGVLATKGTVESGLFTKLLQPEGFEVEYLTPQENDQLVMQSIYGQDGLKSSTVSREAILAIRSTLPILQERGADIIVAGCTEIPLAFAQVTPDIPLIDPMELLASEIIRLDKGFKETSGSHERIQLYK